MLENNWLCNLFDMLSKIDLHPSIQITQLFMCKFWMNFMIYELSKVYDFKLSIL
jgi:hypothetical protein